MPLGKGPLFSEKYELEIDIHNGEIWTNPRTCLQARTQWLEGDKWILLSTPSRAVHGGTCMMAMTEEHGKMFYTAAELQARLLRDGWEKVEVPLLRVLREIERYGDA